MTVKKLITIPLSGALLIGLTVLLSRHFWMSDAEVYRRLTGTWLVTPFHENPNARLTIAFRPEGTYSAEVTCTTNGWVAETEGNWRIRSGRVTDTVTKSTQTNAQLPVVLHGRVIHLNDRELVTTWDGYTQGVDSVEVLARKASSINNIYK